ncbi:unnamed protein product [Macrosiphum euphorbiae]|uniref:Uncharacterized protein n=1 Tax=Macrosiphum euphorbiae TaxID=13131 RepID=A0AAV0WA62_9HEMI|nr:unnamed protein product [Macrosiphum euphorbiae]
MTFNLVELFELLEYKTDGPVSMNVILKLQSWGLIANENTLKCNNGHFLKLYPSSDVCDGFVWRCREYTATRKQKKVRCEYTQSLRKNKFFCKSHLSLYQIVIFSYLWVENVSLEFLSKQVKISKCCG